MTALVRFCREIIDATHRYAAAYKPNAAFFESMGTWGLDALLTVRQHIPPDAIAILDAKRGDMDNTNVQYARAAFDILGFDAITVHPYLGAEALDPFLCRAKNGVFVLCRTSNPGAGEFQDMRIDSGDPLFLAVAKATHTWNKNGNCGLVTGATYPNELEQVRSLAPLSNRFAIADTGHRRTGRQFGGFSQGRYQASAHPCSSMPRGAFSMPAQSATMPLPQRLRLGNCTEQSTRCARQ